MLTTRPLRRVYIVLILIAPSVTMINRNLKPVSPNTVIANCLPRQTGERQQHKSPYAVVPVPRPIQDVRTDSEKRDSMLDLR